MLSYLAILATISAIANGQPTGKPEKPGECCETKMVGGIWYSYVGKMDTKMYNCLNPCVYQKKGEEGAKFCFAMGEEKVECKDEDITKPPMGGSEKPPMEGSEKPPVEGSEKPPVGGSEKPPVEGSTKPAGQGAAQQKTLPWFLGMDPLELCVETGTEVVFNKTGHNVVLMATQSDYDACTGFLGENPTVGNNIDPFIWQADTDGTFYFACGVGTHCSAGGMKAKITVAPKCVKSITLPWSFGMQPQVVCVETGTKVIIDKTGSSHNVDQLTSQSSYDTCTGFTDTQGNSNNPFVYQADTPGVFYFACGVGNGIHCNSGNMKAMVTVADTCPAK